MFGFGKKKSYEEQFSDAVNKKDGGGEADSVARKAFSDKASDEHILAWLAGSIYDLNLERSFDLLQIFTERFPASLHPIKAFTADLYARSGSFDKATLDARVYLRSAKDSGVLDELETKKIIRAGVSRAFLLVTAAYTELGARSFSKDALSMALNYDLSPDWADVIRAEIGRLDEELKDSENLQRDDKWNEFHSNGSNSEELYNYCKETGYPIMAKLIDLIEGNFRFNSNYKVRPESIFNVVIENDGTFVLA